MVLPDEPYLNGSNLYRPIIIPKTNLSAGPVSGGQVMFMPIATGDCRVRYAALKICTASEKDPAVSGDVGDVYCFII
jgi:hypothetical protein